MFGRHKSEKPEQTNGVPVVAKAVGGAMALTAALSGGEGPMPGTDILPTRAPDVPIEQLVEAPGTDLPANPSDMVVNVESAEPVQPVPVTEEKTLDSAVQEAATRVVDGETPTGDEVVYEADTNPQETAEILPFASIDATPEAEPVIDQSAPEQTGEVAVEVPVVVDSGTPAGFPDVEPAPEVAVGITDDGSVVAVAPPPPPPAG